MSPPIALTLLLGLLYLPNSLSTQILNFHQLTAEEGLSESTNEFINTDSHHITWISSLDGLNQFYGQTTEVLKPAQRNPNEVRGNSGQSPFFEASNGDIFFTTGEAINRYERSSGTFTHAILSEGLDTLGSVHYAFHLENDRYLWSVANENLYRYDVQTSGNFTLPLVEDFDIPRAAADTNELGLVKAIYGCNWNNGPGFQLLEFVGNGDSISRSVWFDAINDTSDLVLEFSQVIPNIDGREACLLASNGLLFFNIKNPAAFEFHPLPPGFSNAKHLARLQEELLIATDSSVILRFNLVAGQREYLSETIEAFNLDEQQPIEQIERIFTSPDGMIWVTVPDQGVFYANLQNNRVFSLAKQHKLSPIPIAYFSQDGSGNIWATSEQGEAWVFSSNGAFLQQSELPGYFTQIALQNGTTWAVSMLGLGQGTDAANRFDWNTPNLASQLICYNLAVDESQRILVATSAGIARFNPVENTLRFLNQKFAVALLPIANNRLWTADAEGELALWEVGEDSLALIKAYRGLGIINHFTLDAKRNILWVATSKGLVQLDLLTLKKSIITEADGLNNQYINAVILDKFWNVWLTTNRGITRYRPEEQRSNQFFTITKRDGLSADEYQAGASLIDARGFLWFGSKQGIDVIDPNIGTIGSPPTLLIKNLKIHDQEWIGDSSIQVSHNIRLKNKENTLAFELAALELTDPIRNQFRVYLQHQDGTDTIDLGTKNTITFSNLRSGQYQFGFMATNAEGIMAAKWKTLDFYIERHFLETWWFKTIAAILIVLLVAFISSLYYKSAIRAQQLTNERQQRITERQQQAMEKTKALQSERDRIAGEMHDELGGGLSTIQHASLKAIRKQDPSEIQHILGRISEISAGLSKSMRELIWAMDPKNDALQELIFRIRYFAAEFLNDNDLQAQLSIPESLPALKVSSKFRHNVYMVVKEALHNVLKSAAASRVGLQVSCSEQLIITVSDDGKGFDVNDQQIAGFGIRNSKSRMKAIDGSISWEKNQLGGITVTISAPFPIAN